MAQSAQTPETETTTLEANAAEPVVPKTDIEAHKPARRGPPWGQVLSFVVGLVGVAALGATGWVYAETQREVLRLSTDIAQIRLSLELFGRQHPPGGAASADTGGSSGLQDLSNRLAILEESWRSGKPATGAASLPALANAPAPSATADGGDCLPSGTRILVSAGDSYPICGKPVAVKIGSVSDGFINLADGTTIAAGGTIALVGSSCMLGVVSAGDQGMTGYAEIKVNC